MRLTLRTLLAYLDNILDPKDREVLSGKIRTSEFAQTLVQRMRAVLNDSDLSATELVGRGLGQDPNSVADYLDNTMAPEQLEEFERQCLDIGANANMQLAEVMSCHHVLAMILSEPAQFEASARERMYRLGGSPSAGDETAVTGSFSDESHGPQTEEPLPEEPENYSGSIQESTVGVEDEEATAATYDSKVPDYLRGETSSRRFIPMAVTALVAACVTGAILLMLDSNDFEKSSNEKQISQKKSEPSEEKSPDSETADAGIADPNVQVAPRENGTTPLADSSPPSDPSGTEEADLGADASPKVVETDSEGATANSANSDSANSANSDNPEKNAAPVSDGAKTANSDNKAQPNQPSAESPPKPIAEPDEQPPAGDSDNTGDAQVPQEAVPMGKLLSQDQILLATPDSFDNLRRVPFRDQLKSGQKLISLPTFRPEISLGLMTLEVNGGTMLELLDMDEENLPEIKVHCGQIVLRPNVPNAQLRLRVDPQTMITLALGETTTKIGLEVCRRRTVGRDPEEEPLAYLINIYALGGNVGWQTDDANGVIGAGEQQSFSDSNPITSKAPSSPPRWLAEIEVTELERRAQPRIDQMVVPDRSVKIRLAELAEEKRSEIKQLAMRCSAHIGYYDPLVESFGKKELSRWWEMYAEELHEAAARSPQAAQRLRETLQRLSGNDGFELYRMFWGYSDEGLQNNGEAAQLVNFLDHEELDYRVLSNWNLKRITGLGSQYRPDHSKQKRNKYAERWRNRLNKGEIKHKIEIPATQN